MAKREFLMLAHKYNPAKHGIAGWYMSEKLDGMRCFWDGGASRGVFKSNVPWANCNKDERYVTPPVATGLWSRYGNVIHAPAWWLDLLPPVLLDGELYIEDHRQELMSIVKKQEPGDWSRVKYYCFDIPATVFADGKIGDNWCFKNIPQAGRGLPFRSVIYKLERLLKGDTIIAHRQVQLSFASVEAERTAALELSRITDAGGEGLMLRAPGSIWTPERVHSLVKVKRLDDAEGVVIGYTAGRETAKGSKLLGMMGALILRLPNGQHLELSGFTESERSLNDPDWAIANPGEEVPEDVWAIKFKRGSVVTFRHRGVTRDGIPQEARYWRKHND